MNKPVFGMLLGSFLGHFAIAGRSQLHSPDKGLTTEKGMEDFWAEGFPPSSPLALAKWLVLTHTGQMMAFPIGSQDGGSSLTTLLFLFGCWRFWCARRRALLALCVGPFALGLLAAAAPGEAPRAPVAPSFRTELMPLVAPASAFGLPALALPIGFGPHGLPLGAQLLVTGGDPALAFALGDAYQQVTDWHARRPAFA